MHQKPYEDHLKIHEIPFQVLNISRLRLGSSGKRVGKDLCPYDEKVLNVLGVSAWVELGVFKKLPGGKHGQSPEDMVPMEILRVWP